MTITWDHRTREFAKALSLARPGVPVPYSKVRELAREVLRDELRGAMDAGGPHVDASRVLEDALRELHDFLAGCLDGDDLSHAMELANSVSTASERDQQLREAEQRGAADRGRQAADARPSVLDSVLRGVTKPPRV